MSDYVIGLFMIGPLGSIALFITLYFFFRKSILYNIGLVTGLYALFMGIITTTVLQIGFIHNLWVFPLAISIFVIAFKYISKIVINPMTEINDFFNLLQAGDINSTKRFNRNSKNEFQGLYSSANNLIDGFTEMANFAKEVGKGNLDTEYESQGENDILGNSLIEMRHNLKIAREEEDKRKLEEKKHFWTNDGFAKFGDILRNNNDENNELYYSIINNLVKYTGAIQGGLFLINDDDEDDKHIELVSMYAYERRKYIKKRIEFGETLVGECILEGKSIYMTDIPQNYIRVTSGLGDANPTSLLLVPLKFNDKVYGVIELAYFDKIEEYIKNFIEKVGESIASTISTYKINIKTKKLLDNSKFQSEELAAQEEEIRQNMEELQTTQEESTRRESELNNMLEAIQSTALIAEIDFNGSIISVNNNYSRIIGSKSINMEGSNWQSYSISNEEVSFDDILQMVQNGEIYKRSVTLNNGIKIKESFSLINDESGFPFKILVMGTQID